VPIPPAAPVINMRGILPSLVPAFCVSMIFSENRYTLFRIMLWFAVIRRE